MRLRNAQQMVRAFHERFGLPMRSNPAIALEVDWGRLLDRWNWQMHEMAEMYQAIVSKDIAGVVDAIVDADYFGKGTLVELGVDGEPVFEATHCANMCKVKLPGVAKIAKPAGWKHPDIAALIAEQRKAK